MKTRRRARRVTLETLYEYDIVNHDPAEVLEQRLEANPMERAGVEFAEQLIHGVVAYQEQMDTLIDRNVLRIAIYEFLVTDETPVKVAINEAVELAKVYGSDSAPRFINGVLGTLADHQEELRREILRGAEAVAA